MATRHSCTLSWVCTLASVTCNSLTKEADCITSTIVNMHLDDKVRQGICPLILTWMWRETDNCLTKLTNCQPPASSPSMVVAAAVLVLACLDIVKHLKSGRILFLTSLPPALISQQLPSVTGDQAGGLVMWQ